MSYPRCEACKLSEALREVKIVAAILRGNKETASYANRLDQATHKLDTVKVKHTDS